MVDEVSLPAAKTALRPYLTYPAWIAMGSVLLVTFLLPAQTVAKIAPYPFLLSLVFLGLPHGAWDHRVVAAVRGTRLTWRHLSVVCAVYSVPVVLYGALWLALPAPAFTLFILLSWLHWGQGDAAYLRLWQPARVGPPAFLTWLVRGGAPILLPILRFPEAFARTATGTVGLFAPQGAANWQLSASVRQAGLVVLAGLAALYLFCLLRAAWRGGPLVRASARSDAAEIALLYLVFSVADPLLAVGIYFCIWHGLRHIGRLLLLDEDTRALCAAGQVPSASVRFGWQCLPILVAALALLSGTYLWVVGTDTSGGVSAVLWVYLALIACLTFPHFLLVCWLDASNARNE